MLLSIERISINQMLGLMHGMLLPILLMLLSESRLGICYLLIPTAIYLTVGSERSSKDHFTVYAVLTIVLTVASWADATPMP